MLPQCGTGVFWWWCALGIAGRTAVVYVAILVGLRMAGKRELGQMTVFDLLVLMLLANAVQNAMVGPDTSLVGGLFAAIILLVLNALLRRARAHWPRLGHVLEGTPTVLVFHGKVVEKNLRREGVDEELLKQALREHGVENVGGVDLAVLELDGSISVVPAGSAHKLKKPLKSLRRA
jgi:uncharacterized membrane protein YcaP (DUF421 family)